MDAARSMAYDDGVLSSARMHAADAVHYSILPNGSISDLSQLRARVTLGML